MNEARDSFERELSALRPAKPSIEALDQIETKLRGNRPTGMASRDRAPHRRLNWLWWLTPIAATACCVLLFARWEASSTKAIIVPVQSRLQPQLRADRVEIDRQLMTNYDAIARLPSGEPVRFRCEQWMDKVRVRDSAAGLIVERATPRLEIRPVSFETY